MKLEKADYMLAVASRKFAGVLAGLGDMETRFLKSRLGGIEVDSPVFVTGLARSGTTILLTILSELPGIATHKYKDFPFVFTPVLWNRFVDRFAKEQVAAERPHKDGIQITADSPDAFEEPVWQYFFPHLHKRGHGHVLDEKTRDREFEKFFRDHIRKILLLRKGTRYLSKGNYNISRIAYIAKLFPDAKFIIPVRHPYGHVDSLVKQHRLFTDYAATDDRVGSYLQAAGHYEFGPQRIPINLSRGLADRIEAAWAAGQEHRGYAMQWQAIYGYAKTLASMPALSEQIMLLRFEDLCSEPAEVLQSVFDFLGVDIDPAGRDGLADRITRPSAAQLQKPADHLAEIWDEAGDIATEYGYQPA